MPPMTSTPSPADPAAPTTTAAAVAAPAATVLLLREAASGELEVLMTKRAAGLTFMGGLWVFPGGRMDPADRSPKVAGSATMERIEAVRQRMLDPAGSVISADLALGLHVAACRETFEESGLLLARPKSPSATLDSAQLARVAERRAACGDDATFADLVVAEDLQLELDRLVYWSHWITPSLERRRFDTRFFAVRVPPGQEASVDRCESTQHAWLCEQAVRESVASGEMKMAPPTLATLEDLWSSHAKHGDIDTMLDAERAREVPPILPKMIANDPATVEVVLPWDTEYPALAGEACVVWERYPAYLAALPSRRTLRR
jgi:8-oxo-dGTP pyrophosphatase MutT (NUDIX family)